MIDDRDDRAAAGRTSGDQKILDAFVVGGRLVSIPARQRKREPILRWLRDEVFREDRDYPEREVNALIAQFHPDVAALRRYLVDARLVTRDHGMYRRADPPTAERAIDAPDSPGARP
jgi:hypothetical protein